jgi:hypothetical protein
MMNKKTAFYMACFLLAVSSLTLTACQRQESGTRSAKKPESVAVIQAPQHVTLQVPTLLSSVDNPAITDLLHRIVRHDLPGMTFNQVKALFPTTCFANDEDRTISCPSVAGLISISYGGGPDGIFDMVFSGGMASCKTLKALISQEFGEGEDSSSQNSDGVCDVYWQKISEKNKTYYATLGKLNGRDNVTFQIGAEQGP